MYGLVRLIQHARRPLLAVSDDVNKTIQLLYKYRHLTDSNRCKALIHIAPVVQIVTMWDQAASSSATQCGHSDAIMCNDRGEGNERIQAEENSKNKSKI